MLMLTSAMLPFALLLAYAIPWGVASWLLVIVFLSWIVACLVDLLGIIFVRQRNEIIIIGTDSRESSRLFRLILIVTLGCAIIYAVQQGFLNVFGGYKDLTFNIDHRYILMHSWSIYHHHGASESLSMLGVPINYHSGPAWFAAAAKATIGLDPQVWLFFWFPLAATASIIVGMYKILIGFGFHRDAALLGSVTALIIFPFYELSKRLIDLAFYRHLVYALISDNRAAPDGIFSLFLNWLKEGFFAAIRYSEPMMLNSLLGLSLVVVSLAFFLSAPSMSRLIWAALIISVTVIIKPQYALGGIILLVAVSLSHPARLKLIFTRTALIAIIGALVIVTLYKGFLNYGITPSGNITFANMKSLLEPPSDWHSFKPFIFTEPFFLILLFLFVLNTFIFFSKKSASACESKFGGIILVQVVGLWVSLHFLLDSNFRPQDGATWAWNVFQLSEPVYIVGTAVGVGGVYSVFKNGVMQIFLGLAALVFSFYSILAVIQLNGDPSLGPEVVNGHEIRKLLTNVPVSGSVLLASDLSDPAENHKRKGRAFYLSNVFGHQFWITQTGYGHQRLDLTALRREKLGKFFNAKWAAWHSKFLSGEGITHVLVSTRCMPTWDAAEIKELSLVGAAGGWSVYEVHIDKIGYSRSQQAYSHAVQERSAAFGRADCW